MTRSEAIQEAKAYLNSFFVDERGETRAREAIMSLVESVDVPSATLADAFVDGLEWDLEPDKQIDIRMTYDDLKMIIDLTKKEAKSQKWHYVEKDGNPTDEGV